MNSCFYQLFVRIGRVEFIDVQNQSKSRLWYGSTVRFITNANGAMPRAFATIHYSRWTLIGRVSALICP